MSRSGLRDKKGGRHVAGIPHAGFRADEYLQVTDMGIEKNHDFDYPDSDVQKMAERLISKIYERRKLTA